MPLSSNKSSFSIFDGRFFKNMFSAFGKRIALSNYAIQIRFLMLHSTYSTLHNDQRNIFKIFNSLKDKPVFVAKNKVCLHFTKIFFTIALVIVQ